jgi:hypothetical protein
MTQIRLLSGGAAQGLVGQLKAGFAADQGCEVLGTFGAVGLMRDKLLGGAPCDLLDPDRRADPRSSRYVKARWCKLDSATAAGCGQDRRGRAQAASRCRPPTRPRH